MSVQLLIAVTFYATVIIVWVGGISAVAIVTEQNYGKSVGRLLWIFYAVLISVVALVALNKSDLLS